MHSITELGTSVPAFLGKLWRLVDDAETDDLICWAPNGRSFFIRNQAQFARELLPHYYKHNNMASFIRQLNMYGFHKKVSVELGGLKCDRDEMEFAHQYFCKGHPYLLENIKRKIASSKGQEASQAPIKSELMTKMLTEVRNMRGRQENLDSRFGAMKRENEALWRELAMLRQKHLKQQQIVNKLIHFLVTLVQPARGGGLSVKRRYPLMIDEPNRQRAKQSKMSNVKAQQSPTGPVIHELDPTEHELDSQYYVAEMLDNHASPSVQSPDHRDSTTQDNEIMEPIKLIEDSISLPEGAQLVSPREVQYKPKRRSKGKKKEETLLLDLPASTSGAAPTITLTETKAKKKRVPSATVRSSKLAAMAANMNTTNNDLELDLDLDSSRSNEEDPIPEEEPLLEDLEEILIDPQVAENENVNGNGVEIGKGSFGNVSSLSQLLGTDKTENSGAGTSTGTKDLSLSCVNSTGMNDSAYRLAPMEEVDTHLESMQSDLDNLRDLLRGEGYSIDANTLLGLFGADDPMSFGIPMNPELDPQAQRDKEDEEPCESLNAVGGGELMAYNPSTNLLDFDDDIFLGQTTSLSSPHSETNPLDLEDSKASLLESLSNINNTSS